MTNTAVTNLLYHGLRLARVTNGPGRGPSTAQKADALMVLNRWLDLQNIVKSAIYTVGINLWPTVANQQSYTLGAGGNWNGPRPANITQANLLLPTSPTVRRPISILDDTEWARITLQQVYTYPQVLYNDGAYPLSTIYLRPIPDAIYQIELYTWQAIGTGGLVITDNVSFPPGYEHMLVNNLAMRLSEVFGTVPAPTVPLEAQRSLAAVRGKNIASPKIAANTPFTGRRGGGGFNWGTGMDR